MKRPHVDSVGRRNFLKGSAVATLGLAASRIGQLNTHAFPNVEPEDAAAQHNMLVVGENEKTVFLSHLPMFQAGRPTDPAVDETGTEFTSPHRFQVILEATFMSQGKNVSALYVKDRQAHATTRIYTLEPKVDEPFVLSRLFTPESKPQLRSFTATVFRGHLEQGGEPIAALKQSLVEITRIVHARKFNPKGKKPTELEYILFGNSSELFLAHAIFAPPDFDQVFSIKIVGHEFTETDLNRDIRVVFSDRKNVVGDRLREGQKVSGILTVPGDKIAVPAKIQLQTSVEFYFEEGELLVPHTFKPTPEELKKKE